jgi:cob(I)alamin adenosyltransferase
MMSERGTRRSSKIYSKSGDDGTTSLRDGTRVRKDDERLEACGAVDELNTTVGVAAACWREASLGSAAETLARELESIQQNLCTIETQLLSPTSGPGTGPELVESDIECLEKSIDRMNAELPPLRRFIIPGGGPVAVQLHFCRAICRRAERRCVTLAASRPIPELILRYLNRLGDYFFVAARWAAHLSPEREKRWEPPVSST